MTWLAVIAIAVGFGGWLSAWIGWRDALRSREQALNVADEAIDVAKTTNRLLKEATAQLSAIADQRERGGEVIET